MRAGWPPNAFAPWPAAAAELAPCSTYSTSAATSGVGYRLAQAHWGQRSSPWGNSFRQRPLPQYVPHTWQTEGHTSLTNPHSWSSNRCSTTQTTWRTEVRSVTPLSSHGHATLRRSKAADRGRLPALATSAPSALDDATTSSRTGELDVVAEDSHAAAAPKASVHSGGPAGSAGAQLDAVGGTSTPESAAAAAAATAAAPAAGSAAPKVKKKRMRLDEYCMLLQPQYSRNVIQSFILQGKVRVDERVVTKAGAPVVEGVSRVVVDAEEPKYVCRAGLKLEKALAHFGIDVRGLVALDSGQSTGGFTDCLLQHGAAKVYGIDVGYNQLADRIRRDERVVVMEKFNLRHLQPADLQGQLVDIATLDLSFISVLLVVGAVTRVVRPDGGQLVVLIKPQFEAGRKQVGAGGVVRDPKVHAEVIERVTAGIAAHGYELRGVTESPIKGDKGGNTEFLAHFVRRPELATVGLAEGVQGQEQGAEEEGEEAVKAAGMEAGRGAGVGVGGPEVGSGGAGGRRKAKERRR